MVPHESRDRTPLVVSLRSLWTVYDADGTWIPGTSRRQTRGIFGYREHDVDMGCCLSTYCWDGESIYRPGKDPRDFVLILDWLS